MSKYKIVLMPGDGVGNDVMEAARIVLDKIALDAEYIHADLGWECWRKEGNPLPDRTMELLQSTDACLMGAITSKPDDLAEAELAPELQGKGLSYTSPLLKIRQELNLHTNLRPCKSIPGNPLNVRDDIDLVIFRENTEGLYVGVEYSPLADDLRQCLTKHNPRMARFKNVPADEMAVSLRVITKHGARHIAEQAFKYAAENGRTRVTLVEKANVLRLSSGIMLEMAREVAAGHPGIAFDDTNIDAMTMWLVKNPQDFQVVMTSNMFGDILSDLCAQMVGGMGFGASGNIGDNYGLFEPIHGSAPKYAGQYRVNPVAMLLSVKMMLDFLGEKESALELERAVFQVVAEGKTVTKDMGGESTTLEMARAVAECL